MQEGKEERRTARRLECSTAQTTRRFAAPTFRGNNRLPLPLAQAARGRVVLDDRRRAPTATQSSRGCLRRKSPTLGQLRSSLSLSSPVLILARVHRVLTISSRGVRYERAKPTPMLSLPLRSSPVRLADYLFSSRSKPPRRTYTDRDAVSWNRDRVLLESRILRPAIDSRASPREFLSSGTLLGGHVRV